MSPDGSALVIGSGRTSSLVLVDVESMRRTGRVATRFTTALAWPRADRVLFLERELRRWRLVLVDPRSHAVVLRRPLGVAGGAAAAATTRDGLAVLFAPRAASAPRSS